MSIEIKNLPSLIAIPYSETLKKDSIQRKDFQRITLENVLSLNAIISLSNYYQQNKSDEDGEKKEKFPELKNFDLGQISVGTWNMFSRESNRAMGANTKALFLNNIYEMYHGSKAKEWDELSGALISIRNKDAHGELIPADKLGAELDKRQVVLDKFVENLSFYNDYKIIVPTNTTLESGKIVYNCRDFSGITENSVTISDSKDELEILRVYLYNIKSKRALKLNPMLIAHFNQSDVSSAKLFIYSKTINKKLGNLHYLSLDSSKDFLSNDTVTVGDYFTGEEICREFQNFRIYVEDPSLHDQKKPQLDISRVIKSDFIGKNDLIELSFTIKNEGEISADNVKIVFNYPEDNFLLTDSNGDAINSKKGLSSLWEEDLIIDAGQSFSKKLYFQPKDSGQYEFPEIIVSYEYTDFQGNEVKPKVEKDGTTINIETAPALYCTVYDPADPFSLAPVININMSVDFGLDEYGKKRIFAYIGETIPLIIKITNQGLGVAKDVDFTIFVPDGITLDQINTNWRGNINPLQEVTKTYDLKLKEPGIHSLVVREIVYSNQDNKTFETRGGAYNILVRNNPEVQYRQLMQKIWADLEIDDEELEEMHYLSKKYGKLLEEPLKQSIEADEKLKVIKTLITSISVSKGFKLIEKIVSGNKMIYAYNSIECPILVVDYGDTNDIKIYLRVDLQGKYPIELISIKGYLRNLPMAKIGMKPREDNRPQDFQGGANALKGFIGRAIGWIEKNDWMLLQLKYNFSAALGITSELIHTKTKGNKMEYLITNQDSSTNQDEMIAGFYTYIDERKFVHLVAKVNLDVSVRKYLTEKGYKFLTLQNETEPVPFVEATNATSFLKIMTQKINNDNDKNVFAKSLVSLILLSLEVQNSQLQAILTKKNIDGEQISNILEIHNSILNAYNTAKDTGGLLGVFYKFDYEEKGKNYNCDFTYYAIKELPLYQDKQIILRVNSTKSGILLHLRNMSDLVIESLNGQVSFRKDFLPFSINYSETIISYLHEILDYSLQKSNTELVKPNYSMIKAIMENEWVGSLDILLDALLEMNKLERETTYEEVNNYLIENDNSFKIMKTLSFLRATFSTRKWEPFLEYNKINGFSIKTEYEELVQKALENYLVVVDDMTANFHKLKHIINKLNLSNNPANGLRKIKLPNIYFSIYDDKAYCYYEFKNVKNMKVKLGMYIFAQNENVGHEKARYIIKQIKNIILSGNIPSLFGVEPKICDLEYLQRDSKVKSGAISIEIPYNSAEDMLSLSYVNKLVMVHNEFCKILIPESDLNQIMLREGTIEDLA